MADAEHGSTRRSTEQVRAELLDAAAAEFASAGYDATSVRTIARVAGLSLSVLYRHFPSKEQLYLAALLRPFAAAFDEFANAWRRQLTHGSDDEEMVREFATDLYRNFTAQREALLQLVSLRDSHRPELADGFRRAFNSAFDVLTQMSQEEARSRQWPEPAISRHSVWLAVSLVVGQIVMEPWAPPGAPGDRRRGAPDVDVPDLITRLLLYGVRLDPPDAG